LGAMCIKAAMDEFNKDMSYEFMAMIHGATNRN